MRIRFTKRDDGQDILTCIRADGSVTWGRNPVGVPHDLLHYAAETTLGCREAFWGMVAGGRDLDAFGTRGSVRDAYPVEALRIEHLVGLLQWPSSGGGVAMADEVVADAFREACDRLGMAGPAVTPSQIAAIRAAAETLMDRWSAVAPGETLELTFPAPA